MFVHDTILTLYAEARRTDDLAPRRARRPSRPATSRTSWLARLFPESRLTASDPTPTGPRTVATAR